jgi:hypothetical protein
MAEKAVKFTIVASQGADWKLTVLYKDASGAAINMTGYTAKMQIRERTTEGAVLKELTHAGGITLGSDGTIVLRITGPDLLSFKASSYDDPHVYDLFVTDGSSVPHKVIYGSFVNLRAVTR